MRMCRCEGVGGILSEGDGLICESQCDDGRGVGVIMNGMQ